MKIIIGTRGSKLALAQTYYIKNLLENLNENLSIDVKIIKTTGDKNQKSKLSELGLGVFTKELDTKMLNNEIDIAVHSLKDVPTVWNENLTISATPKRESYHDLIIWNKNNDIDIEKDNLIVGTSSIRRKAFLSIKYPNLKTKLLRGNIDTRLRKLRENNYDAIILAEAGLNRLKIDLSEFNYKRLKILPAPAQGVIGVASRKDDKEIIDILKKINDNKTYLESIAERYALREYGGGCQAPFGALSKYDTKNNELYLTCDVVYTLNGKNNIISKEDKIQCDIEDIHLAKKIGIKLGKEIKEAESEKSEKHIL
ncbi:hydroxymethylbilane synthase [Methanothermococcus okinawensis]|uniref:Probable porphobilinogen deaminase n=1 Tax=Methanothermococcus okinawensis (strain DSM 14208 / JCM 11175 / IH1) TaxID=647113 RepID=F8ALM4_METOI|nr:hydroxymethylbilane synthase [Methanothermococcus okinawensis]AEH06572.1 Porphobilinogen deaminase [Methanothermococcus okinawensis IH1]